MKVILLKNIENLGEKYEIKKVKAGYAKNFLIPKGLVKVATKKNLEWLKAQKEIQKEEAEKELKEVQSLASKLDGQEITFPVKLGQDGQIVGVINTLKIYKELKNLGFEIKKSQIELAEPLKELGEFPVKINLPHKLEAEIKVIVEKITEEAETPETAENKEE